MKITKAFLLGFTMILGVSGFTSCSKDDENDGATFEVVDATLSWSGDYAVDGCGYILQIGETSHKPVNESDITDSYKADSPVAVEVKLINYNKKTKIVCGIGTEMNSVQILDVRRK